MLRLLFLFLFNIVLCEPFEGLTLITEKKYPPFSSLLIDNDFNIINEWQLPCRPSSIAYLMPDSSLILPCRGSIKRFDWGGNQLWEYNINEIEYLNHHDIEPLPNGNVLVICWEVKTEEEARSFGRQNVDSIMSSLAIIELAPTVDENEAQIVWEWHAWDHLIQDIDSLLPNYGTISDNPQLLDINLVEYLHGERGDWLHTNSIHYSLLWDQIILSSRFLNEFFIIDHSTSIEEASGHSGGNSGQGGDLLYRWGNPQNYGRGNNSHQVLFSQHSVNWIPSGFPGSGNIILFNNEHTTNYSSVIELEPPVDSNGNYLLEEGEMYGPENFSWIYLLDYDSDSQSGAFKLQNGNVLFSTYIDNKTTEINEEGQIVWEYYFDYNGEVNQVARTIKYGYDYFYGVYPTSEINKFGDIDLNGVVNYSDVSLLLKYLVQLDELSNQQILNSNVSPDSTISALDASVIQKFISGLIDSLPINSYIDSHFATGDVHMQDDTIEPGSIVEVPISIVNCENILSFEAEISFDPIAMSFHNVIWGDSLVGFNIESNIIDSKWVVAGSRTLPYDYDGVFSTLQFIVNDSIEGNQTTVSLNKICFNENIFLEDVATIRLTTLGIKNNVLVPSSITLHQNYPNPFNPKTTISYYLPESNYVIIEIYNIQGRKDKTLIHEKQNAGFNSVLWNSKNDNNETMVSGIYIYRIQVGDFIQNKKMILLK